MIPGGCIYFMTNKHKTTLYLGVTSNLIRRVQEHKNRYYPFSFTARYNLEYLVYYEFFSHIEEAIAMEKQIKKMEKGKERCVDWYIKSKLGGSVGERGSVLVISAWY